MTEQPAPLMPGSTDAARLREHRLLFERAVRENVTMQEARRLELEERWRAIDERLAAHRRASPRRPRGRRSGRARARLVAAMIKLAISAGADLSREARPADRFTVLVVTFDPPRRPARRAPPSLRDAPIDEPQVAGLAALFAQLPRPEADR